MKRIDTETYNNMENACNELISLGVHIGDLSNDINDAIADIIGSTKCQETGMNLFNLIDEFQSLKSDLTEKISECIGEMESFQDTKSQKWRESDKGQIFDDWLEQWSYIHGLSKNAVVEIAMPTATQVLEAGELFINVGVSEEFELPEQAPEW